MVGAAALSAVSGAAAAMPQVFVRKGTAINGYDPVAYFTEGRPVAGRRDNGLIWNGAEWRFATRANLAAFESDPTRYAPQYGGYCAYAVSRGYTAKTEPEAWLIVDRRLYLNFNLRVRGLWSRDIPGNIRKANANWPGVLEA